ncbi:MAG: SMI1/KNR4 family protein [Micrococcales bacterium]|nr:SMI1/KNR4 family protein [Micrococcales bacterium]MCL2668536.1 SMI1/KNR4 family protein [Micrococcales bacterium]
MTEDYARAERIVDKAARIGLSLGPLMDPAAIDAIEVRLAVAFPESYRVFLTHVGGYDVIYPLDQSLQKAEDWETDLTKDCPLVDDLDEVEFEGREPDPDTHSRRLGNAQDLLDSGREPSSPEHDRDLEYFQAFCTQWHALMAGTIEIAEHGCGDFYRLVLDGPSAGQVWTTSLPTQTETHGKPGYDDPSFWSLRVDILTWYERYLDWCLGWRPPPETPSVLAFGDNPDHNFPRT